MIIDLEIIRVCKTRERCAVRVNAEHIGTMASLPFAEVFAAGFLLGKYGISSADTMNSIQEDKDGNADAEFDLPDGNPTGAQEGRNQL